MVLSTKNRYGITTTRTFGATPTTAKMLDLFHSLLHKTSLNIQGTQLAIMILTPFHMVASASRSSDAMARRDLPQIIATFLWRAAISALCPKSDKLPTP